MNQEEKDIEDAVERLRKHTGVTYPKDSALIRLAAQGNRAAKEGVARAKLQKPGEGMAEALRNSKIPREPNTDPIFEDEEPPNSE
jgi:hypothetical protein